MVRFCANHPKSQYNASEGLNYSAFDRTDLSAFDRTTTASFLPQQLSFGARQAGWLTHHTITV